jgi:phage N-6-adenine-methyltransferase
MNGNGYMRVALSSATDEWSTPPGDFSKIAREFGPFDLDVCATAENAKCEHYFTSADDGLAQAWRGRCWMNPPYGRGLNRWMRKARWSLRSCRRGLIPLGGAKAWRLLLWCASCPAA